MQNGYCLCVSGNLGNIVLQKLYNEGLPIVSVLTDYKSDGIIEYCVSKDIKYYRGNPRGFKASNWLDEHSISFGYLLSINYLFILEEDVLNRARIAVNFHGSLLPKYRGRTPHVWAIINGEKECGITAHLMNAQCDDGDIVKQFRIPINDEDTGADILEKYNETYPDLVCDIVELISTGQITTRKQDITKATYFGKRTSEDGGINWNWQKERIHNWVRAQAKPYPGAFSHIGNEKIIIHKVSYSDIGFIDTTINGSVISIKDNKPIIKTQNGAIALEDYEYNEIIKEGQILKTI